MRAESRFYYYLFILDLCEEIKTLSLLTKGPIGIPGVPGFPGGPGMKVRFSQSGVKIWAFSRSKYVIFEKIWQ